MSNYIISSVMAISAGFSINSYKEYAMKQGWPIGKIYTKYKVWIAYIAIMAMLGGAIELFFVTKWYFALALILFSLILSWFMTMLFKQNIQWLAFIILLVSVFVYMVFGAEVII